MKDKTIDTKMKYLLGAVGLVILILLARVSYLQLVQTEQYRTLARNNYVRIVPVMAPRGEVFDRKGTKIVTNKPIYTVSVSDLNLKGTSYHLYLHQTSSNIVALADMLAQTLAPDEEALPYLEQAAEQTMGKYAQSHDINLEELKNEAGEQPQKWHDFKKQFIAAKVKQLAQIHKNTLEQGQAVEIAVFYHPLVLQALQQQDLASFGVTVEKNTDALAYLAEMILAFEPGNQQPGWQIELKVRQEINDKKVSRPYEPVLVAEDVSPSLVVALREKQMEMPGVVVDVLPVRDYPYQELLTHALGYVQGIKQEQYEQNKDEGYLLNDLYGQNGLERVYEKYLRGEHGARQVEVDAVNRPVRDLGLKPAVPGNDLVLTVDLKLQQTAEKALADTINRAKASGFSLAGAGAAVAIDVNTGAVLAMASSPSYHPGIFTGGLTSNQWQQLQNSGALINRVIGATYPPGSTFKMVTAAAILDRHIVDPTHQINCVGYYKYGSGTFKDWQAGGHGRVDLRRALEVSCNPYFYQYGRLAGVDAIAQFAKEFGLGQKTGIDLPGEVAGIVPTPQWKRELAETLLVRYHQDFALVRELNNQIEAATSESQKQKLQHQKEHEMEKQLAKHTWELNWQQFETINMSIGQGDNTYTLLQLAGYVAAIANSGTLYQPYMVDKIISPRNDLIKKFRPITRHQVNLDAKHMQIIQQGMRQAAQSPTGTASSVFAGFAPGAAAKTGTIEVLDSQGRKKGTHGSFVAYAPYSDPKIAVAVMIEFVDSGSGYAGPVARQILDAYFDDADAAPGADEPDVSQDPDQLPQPQSAGNGNPADWSNHIAAIAWPGQQLAQGGAAGAYVYGNLNLYQLLEQKQHLYGSNTGVQFAAPAPPTDPAPMTPVTPPTTQAPPAQPQQVPPPEPQAPPADETPEEVSPPPEPPPESTPPPAPPVETVPPPLPEPAPDVSAPVVIQLPPGAEH